MKKYQLDSMAIEFYGHDYEECDEDQRLIVRNAVDKENENELLMEEDYGDDQNS